MDSFHNSTTGHLSGSSPSSISVPVSSVMASSSTAAPVRAFLQFLYNCDVHRDAKHAYLGKKHTVRNVLVIPMSTCLDAVVHRSKNVRKKQNQLCAINKSPVNEQSGAQCVASHVCDRTAEAELEANVSCTSPAEQKEAFCERYRYRTFFLSSVVCVRKLQAGYAYVSSR